MIFDEEFRKKYKEWWDKYKRYNKSHQIRLQAAIRYRKLKMILVRLKN